MRVRFHPQAWINDYAVEVDPQGGAEQAAARYHSQGTTAAELRAEAEDMERSGFGASADTLRLVATILERLED